MEQLTGQLSYFSPLWGQRAINLVKDNFVRDVFQLHFTNKIYMEVFSISNILKYGFRNTYFIGGGLVRDSRTTFTPSPNTKVIEIKEKVISDYECDGLANIINKG